jgi:hypothetical protein
MLNEIKYIIVKNKAGRLSHYKSDYLHHSIIARDNGYNESEVIEAGLFLDKELYILECISAGHIQKRAGHYIGNRLNEYQDIRLQNWLRGRELESNLYYSKKAVGVLPQGD